MDKISIPHGFNLPYGKFDWSKLYGNSMATVHDAMLASLCLYDSGEQTYEGGAMFVGVLLSVKRDKGGEIISYEKLSAIVGESKEEISEKLLDQKKGSNGSWAAYTTTKEVGLKTTREVYIGELTEQASAPPPIIKSVVGLLKKATK